MIKKTQANEKTMHNRQHSKNQTQKIMENTKRKNFAKIFEMLDSDNDG